MTSLLVLVAASVLVALAAGNGALLGGGGGSGGMVSGVRAVHHAHHAYGGSGGDDDDDDGDDDDDDGGDDDDDDATIRERRSERVRRRKFDWLIENGGTVKDSGVAVVNAAGYSQLGDVDLASGAVTSGNEYLPLSEVSAAVCGRAGATGAPRNVYFGRTRDTDVLGVYVPSAGGGERVVSLHFANDDTTYAVNEAETVITDATLRVADSRVYFFVYGSGVNSVEGLNYIVLTADGDVSTDGKGNAIVYSVAGGHYGKGFRDERAAAPTNSQRYFDGERDNGLTFTRGGHLLVSNGNSVRVVSIENAFRTSTGVDLRLPLAFANRVPTALERMRGATTHDFAAQLKSLAADSNLNRLYGVLTSLGNPFNWPADRALRTWLVTVDTTTGDVVIVGAAPGGVGGFALCPSATDAQLKALRREIVFESTSDDPAYIHQHLDDDDDDSSNAGDDDDDDAGRAGIFEVARGAFGGKAKLGVDMDDDDDDDGDNDDDAESRVKIAPLPVDVALEAIAQLESSSSTYFSHDDDDDSHHHKHRGKGKGKGHGGKGKGHGGKGKGHGHHY